MTRTFALPVLLPLCLGAALGPACDDDDRSRGSDGDSDGDADGDSDGDADDNCSEASKSVYVVDSDNSLYRFDPPAKTFDLVGVIDCDNGSSPYSMAVTREAVAYVLFQSGEIFEVSTSDASCSPTAYATGQGAFDLFGMGFATDGEDTAEETLYIASDESLAALGDDWLIEMIGPVSGSPELTGNGLGELWGFFPSTDTPHVSRIDKDNASLVTTYPLAQLSNSPSAWAFAYFGAAFYVFYESDLDASTNVYRVDAGSGEVETWIPDSGKRIVGAGVSTCAPTTVE